MKNIGRTETGDYIISMTEAEIKEFDILARAVEGRSCWEIKIGDRHTPVMLENYTGVFGAIRAFAEAQFRVNELAQFVDDIRHVLSKEDKR